MTTNDQNSEFFVLKVFIFQPFSVILMAFGAKNDQKLRIFSQKSKIFSLKGPKIEICTTEKF